MLDVLDVTRRLRSEEKTGVAQISCCLASGDELGDLRSRFR